MLTHTHRITGCHSNSSDDESGRKQVDWTSAAFSDVDSTCFLPHSPNDADSAMQNMKESVSASGLYNLNGVGRSEKT